MTTKEKKIYNFVLNQIPTIRAVCLRYHISNVGGVIAYLIKTGDGKTIDYNDAIKHHTDVDYSKFIFDNKLNAYNGFFISWNDILNKKNDVDFYGACYANNLDANYIRGC